jgi:glycosyltransferase involved in cell wall biosynthesis
MNILHTVEFYEPYKGGSEEVVRQISERLVKRGHNVTVATSFHTERNWQSLNGVQIKQFKIKGNQVKGFIGDIEDYQRFLIVNNYDIVLNYNVQTWTTDLTFPLLDVIKAKKILCPIGFSKLKHKRYSKYYKEIPSYLKKYDKLFYTSANYQDKYFGDEHGLSEKAKIITNGSNSEEFNNPSLGFKEKYGIETKYMFISVSNHYLAKGHKFIIDAFRELDNKESSLVIIGEKPYAHSWYSCYPYCRFNSFIDKRIKIFSEIPREWVVSAFNEADLFLFGSKVECAPIVMYECFASKTPFITRIAGNVLDHEQLLWIVKTPDDMVNHMRFFLKDSTSYEQKATIASDEFEAHFNWQTITDAYENTYLSILKM